MPRGIPNNKSNVRPATADEITEAKKVRRTRGPNKPKANAGIAPVRASSPSQELDSTLKGFNIRIDGAVTFNIYTNTNKD